jgi:hexosaminidase
VKSVSHVKSIRPSPVKLLTVLTTAFALALALTLALVQPAANNGTGTTEHVQLASASQSGPPTLAASGYTLLPQPQEVTYAGQSFQITSGWQIAPGAGVSSSSSAVSVLQQDLASRDGLHLQVQQSSGSNDAIVLQIRPNSVAIGHADDQDSAALAQQAYRLQITPSGVTVTANASTGLLYGVDTLIQLVKFTNGVFDLPVTTITDWPDVQYRNILWDDSLHLDKMSVLEAAVRQASFYKINNFVLKLDGHFQYESAPAVAEPEAMSPQQLQTLTNYGLQYGVQVIPYFDAPGHDDWILKHPQYNDLEEYPGSDYEMCTTNPATYKLLDSMLQNLMDANKGVNYFVLSTDEPYYVGLSADSQCDEQSAAAKLGSSGKLEAAFLKQVAGYLHAHGRTVQFWGEFPIESGDISSLPSYLINGETDGPAQDKLYEAAGIRQEIYTYTQGTQYLFPSYYLAPSSALPSASPDPAELSNLYTSIKTNDVRGQSNLVGVFNAAWGDSGLNQATFWLGFAAGAAWSWHPGTPGPAVAASRFYTLFYGQGAGDMARIYHLMSTQAEFYQTSWQSEASAARIGIWGDSNGQFVPRQFATDQYVTLPATPNSQSLALSSNWSSDNASLLAFVQKYSQQNKQLLSLLKQSISTVQFNKYNLEVFQSIAELEQQNLEFLSGLNTINQSLEQAQNFASAGNASSAVGALDSALSTARLLRNERNTTFSSVVDTWYQGMYPRVEYANGRYYLNIENDVKDYLPDRTVDMSYLIYRELLLPMDSWFSQLQSVRNSYAAAHNVQVAVNSAPINWDVYPLIGNV